MTSPIRTLIGSRIRSHRKARQITQAALAEALDCEVTTIGRYERGDHSPDGEQLVKLANFFNVSPIEFLPAEIDIRWQTVCELRSVLIDLVYRIQDPAELQRLIIAARATKTANLR
ncbi:transcriptional regulator with XRE-family HTH domain [Pseudomonas sp. BIGb0381]|uniref:helix-turn-helix domain-containing protein n=1 Tax=Pseudomonas TaxID=286 RepID=UPI002168B9E3|nr:helix-turn-helix transcriptional regulator [Pseudomonas sp. BIGb0381]MCS4315577.1 transcriptional regulator with XRE-family HTH domain [Pseudomonas sp. BIGb0381]